jgi:hypothetical protein
VYEKFVPALLNFGKRLTRKVNRLAKDYRQRLTLGKRTVAPQVEKRRRANGLFFTEAGGIQSLSLGGQ